jgi:hypothetical protein
MDREEKIDERSPIKYSLELQSRIASSFLQGSAGIRARSFTYLTNEEDEEEEDLNLDLDTSEATTPATPSRVAHKTIWTPELNVSDVFQFFESPHSPFGLVRRTRPEVISPPPNNSWQEFYDNPHFSDVVVSISNVQGVVSKLYCHSLVLSKSHVLCAMIEQQGTRRPVELRVSVKDTNAFCCMIQHLYGYSLPTQSVSFLVSLLATAQTYRVASLEQESYRLIKCLDSSKFELFLQSDSFLQLEYKQVVDLLSRNDIPVESETVVYEAVCFYLAMHRNIQKEELQNVIRFPKLSLQYLVPRLTESPFTLSTPQINELMFGGSGDFSFFPSQYERRKRSKLVSNETDQEKHMCREMWKEINSPNYQPSSLSFSSRRIASPNSHNNTPPQNGTAERKQVSFNEKTEIIQIQEPQNLPVAAELFWVIFIMTILLVVLAEEMPALWK